MSTTLGFKAFEVGAKSLSSSVRVHAQVWTLCFADIEKAIRVPPPPLLSVHPMRPLFEACKLLIQTHARRLPLIDTDDQTGKEVVLSVLTQYRVLKFMAVNVSIPRLGVDVKEECTDPR